MNEHEKNLFAEYRQIKELRSGNSISLSQREYVKLKSTLDILEIGGYIIDLRIDGGHIYAVDDTFEFLDKDSLVHNLIHMKASLEGYMCVFPETKKRTTQSSGDGDITMQAMRTEMV